MDKKVYRVGIIGTGRIAHRFVPEARTVEGIEVVAVYNPRITSAVKFAEELNIAYATDDIECFMEKVDADAKAQPLLFYVWGHSYEFNDNDNWELIEEFCKTVGGRDNVWYATNIEIYDYIMAQRSLHIAADESIIHNPSRLDVWLTKDNEIVKIPAGETVYF